MTIEDDGLRATPEPRNRPQTQADDDKANKSRMIVRSAGLILSLVVLVVCSYLLYNLFKDTIEIPAVESLLKPPTAEEVITEKQTQPLPEQQLEAGPEAETEAVQPIVQIPLPKLDNSDQEIRQAGLQLNPAQQWADWITTEEAIRKFVVVIDNLAQGKIAHKYLPIPKPEDKFKDRKDGDRVYLDSAGFERYTPYISLFENIDSEMASALYQRYSPLLEQAFSELGYADRNFHDTLMQAFDVLLNTPVVEQNIELVRPSVFYKYANPTLEDAPAVHKQLIRMGPENTRKLQQKVRQLKAALNSTKK